MAWRPRPDLTIRMSSSSLVWEVEVQDDLAGVQEVNAIADLEDLVIVVHDQNDRDAALAAQILDQAQNVGALPHAKSSQRLIQNQDGRRRINRTSNCDGLALAAGQQVDCAVHARNLDSQRIEISLSQIMHLPIVEQLQSQDALVVLASEEHVVVNTEVVDQREVLVDSLDALGARVAR